MRYKEEVYFAYWDMQSVSQYLYGSSVRVLEDGRVLYENQFMPSGTVIHEWYSKANYQNLRNTSQLPDLKRGEKYVIGVALSIRVTFPLAALSPPCCSGSESTPSKLNPK